jgi:uncharacterized repeat protein (TIGR03803 family)
MRFWTILALLAAGSTATVSAAEYRVLHNFCVPGSCVDGRFPVAPLTLDGAGNLYGTTSRGGAHDSGTVFAVARTDGASVFHRLYSFAPSGGANPQAALMLDQSGALYGTAINGGSRGEGTLFKLTQTGAHWRLHVFHDFCSSSFCSDGSNPISGASYAQARSGAPYDGMSDVYGVTQAGGLGPYGVLYRWTPRGGEHIVKSFCAELACTDGAQPNGEIAFNDAGFPCGTTHGGGMAQHGTLFCLDAGDAIWSYSFCSLLLCADGAEPSAGIAPDGKGNVIGTTRFGGRYGQGTVYGVSAGAAPHRERVIHSFCRMQNCIDGRNPAGAVLIIGDVIYGTTSGGGKYDGGTIFKIDADGRMTLLHSFCRASGCADGTAPQAGLVSDGNGHLFGTTTQGGRNGGGVVFEIAL